MTTNHYHGSIVISGGELFNSNPTIHYNTPGLQSPTSVDANARGPTGAHEAHFSSPNPPIRRVSFSVANASPPTARPQRSFPRSFSLDSDYHPGWEIPSFPADRRRSSTLPLSPPSDPSGLHASGFHRLPPDWPAYYAAESPDVVYGFRVPVRRDSAVPFQPIGNPLQHQPVPEQDESFQPIENPLQYQPIPRQLERDQPPGPMPQAHTPGSQPTSPVVWGGGPPIEGYGVMPTPQYQSTVSSTPWLFDDREIDTIDDVGQSHGSDQTYC